MSITQRGNSWQVYVAMGNQRFRKSFSTQADAVAMEALVRQAMEQGKPIPSIPGMPTMSAVTTGIWTLKEAADRAFNLHWKGDPIS